MIFFKFLCPIVCVYLFDLKNEILFFFHRKVNSGIDVFAVL